VGGGVGTNPEQLFAAGYSACFIGAMKFVAGRDKIQIPADLAIDGSVGYRKRTWFVPTRMQHVAISMYG
jgi:organic hydroperoxide reductase OsmC/OhrA